MLKNKLKFYISTYVGEHNPHHGNIKGKSVHYTGKKGYMLYRISSINI